MLVDICEWPFGEIEDGLDVEHVKLEVVSIEDVCHVAKE